MTCSRRPCTFSSRVIGRSSQSGSPATGWFTLGTIGQMALTVSGHKCQHYSGSGHSRLDVRVLRKHTSAPPAYSPLTSDRQSHDSARDATTKKNRPQGSPRGRWLPRQHQLLLQQLHRRLGLVGRHGRLPGLARHLGLAHERRGLLEVGRARRLDVLTPRRLDVRPPRRLDVLPPRRLDVVRPRRLDVLAPRRLDVLAPRRLDVLAPRRLDVLAPNNSQRARRL